MFNGLHRASLPPSVNYVIFADRCFAAVFQSLAVALVHSRLDYGNGALVRILCSAYLLHRVRSVLNAAARMISHRGRSDHLTSLQ